MMVADWSQVACCTRWRVCVVPYSLAHLTLRLMPRVEVPFALVERVTLARHHLTLPAQALPLLGQSAFLSRQRLVLMRLPPPHGWWVWRATYVPGGERVRFAGSRRGKGAVREQ